MTEQLFDWFFMGYINAIRAFWARSIAKSTRKKRESTAKWSTGLKSAEMAHATLRRAASAATKREFEETEELAVLGMEQLTER